MSTSINMRTRLKQQTAILACIASLVFHTVEVRSQDYEFNGTWSTSYNIGVITQIFGANETNYSQETTQVLAELNVSCCWNSTHVFCVDLLTAILFVPRQLFNITTQYINLSNNSITEVTDDDFEVVELVEFINLQNNQISYIDPNAFRNLFRLKHLNLKSNNLTNLDPAGLTFQHLVSLRYLNLQDNDISTINKFSFLTLQSIAGTETTTILLTGNPIICDCSTLDLRLWVQSIHVLDIQLDCANDADVLDFKNIYSSVFGSCTAELNQTFGGHLECPVCFAEETNYGCSLDAKKIQSCLSQEMICQKTVSWDASSYRMQINARCENYQKCMNDELDNALNCGNKYQENGDLSCRFCCRGPTCSNDTIGGRTVDYTFFLRMLKDSQLSLNPSYMTWEEFIIRGIKAVLTDVHGGKDVTVLYERPQTDQNSWVVMGIHITTFSFIAKETILEQLIHIFIKSLISLNSYFSREELPFNLTADDLMEVKYGRECNVSTDICSEGTRCVPSVDDRRTRCLCNLSSFYSTIRKICLPVELLMVRNLSMLSSTHDTVDLTWLPDSYGANVSYSIQPSPYQGFVGRIGSDGASWHGLTPGTMYNFTVTSTVSNLISTKISIYNVWTKALHGNSCDPDATSHGNICAGKHVECLRAADGVNRCLCPLGYYFHPDGSCHKVEDLQITNLTVSVTSQNRVTLNWFFSAVGVYVNYMIQSYPNVGHLVEGSLKQDEACWEDLEPGKSYNFSVTSFLPASAWYNEQIVSTLNASITIVPVRNVTIFLSYMKQNSTFQPNRTQILAGVQSVIEPLVLSVSGEVTEIVPKINQQLGVTVQLFITFQPVTNLTQTISQAVLDNSRDPSGFFFQESLTTLKVYLNYSEVLHGSRCNLNGASNGNFCAGKYTECLKAADGVNRCLCPLGYYFHPDGSCHEVDDLHMTNLTVSLTGNNSVTLYWSVNWSGINMTYAIQSSPSFGHLVQNSLRAEKAQWTGLEPGRSYNFTVTSILLSSLPWYNAQIVSSLSALIKLESITIFLTYIKQNSTFQTYMNESTSPKFREEQNRIVSGITSTISRIVPPMSGEVVQFEPMDNNHLKVTVKLTFTSSQTDTQLAETINEAVQNNSRDLQAFFFQEKIQSILIYSNSSVVLQCPYSTTFLDTGSIAWTMGERGTHSVKCPFNLFQDPAPVATRECVEDPVGLLSWTEVNDSACLDQEVLAKIGIEDLLEVTITAENAWLVSSLLKSYTNKSENFTSKLVDQTLTLLDKLATEDMLKDPVVTHNVMNCISNLIDVDPATLEQSQKESSSSQRLLNLIDTVPAKAELFQDKLTITTPNLAIAALHLDTLQKEDILLLLNREEVDGLNNDRVNIDVAIKDIPNQLDKAAMVIPTQAILKTLSSEESKKLGRIAFAFHRTDILFSTIQKMEIKTSSPSHAERELQTTGDSSGGHLIWLTKINSGVLSASVPGVKVHNLSSNVTMTFKIFHPNATSPRCVFWDKTASKGKGNWSGEGCWIVESTATEVTCGCNHLTNFALLMDVYDESSRLSDLDRLVLSVISYVGCAISALALLLTLVTYSIIRQVIQYSFSEPTQRTQGRKLRRDNPSKILINLCVALLLSNLTFLLGMQDYSFRETASCKAVAVLLHYFLLASLTWMAIEAFYMYLALVVVFKTYYTKFLLKCSLVGWGVPLLIVVITLAVNRTDNYGLLNSGMCWLKNPAFYGAFVAPVCFIMLINYMTFALVIRQLVTMSSSRLNKSDKHSTVQRLRGAMGVVTLLGLSWLFAIFAIGQASVVFYYLFAVFNSFQGLFIFIFYCFFKKDVWTSLKRSLVCFAEYGDSTRSQTNGVTAIRHNYNVGKDMNASSSSENSMSTSSTALDPSRKDSCVSTTSVSKSSSSYSYINPTFVDTENLASFSDTPTVLPNEYSLWLSGATKSHLHGDTKLKNGETQDKSLLEYDNLNSLLLQADKHGGELSTFETVKADSSSFYPYILDTFNSFLPENATTPSNIPEHKECNLDLDNTSEYIYSSFTPPSGEEPKKTKSDSSHTNEQLDSSLSLLNTEETVDADYVNKNINIKQQLKWQASNSSERSGTSV